MQISEVSIDKIKPYANNPRKNDEAVDKVVRSIKDYGFQQPIVVDKDGVIIVGHTRLKAAQKLKMDTVPVVYADLPEDKANEYRLVDNKTNEFAEWDFDLLDIELENLPEFDAEFYDFNINIGGVEESEPDDNEFDDIEKLDTHYGVPYQGNKSRIADIIINILPKGKRLVDLFGGGGAITHCAMLSGKWEEYLYNDINEMITGLFLDAVYGKYHDEHRVITREQFDAEKDTDAYIKYIWSFGNNGLAYLWGKDIEEIKCTACHAIIDPTLRERRIAYMNFINILKGKQISNRLEPLERVQELHALESLERLHALESLEITNKSYTDYQYKDGDIVYCDIPYEQINKGKCDDYGLKFDNKAFYEWVKQQPYQIFFSSYDISDNSFHKKKVKTIQSLIGATTNSKKVTEYLYSNRPFED